MHPTNNKKPDPVPATAPNLRSKKPTYLPFACTLMLGLLTPAPFVSAQTTEARQNSGVITGRVANAATGQYLPNAVVQIKGSTLETRTADDGYFRISGLAAGSYAVTASFEGLDTAERTINVVEGQTMTLSFDLGAEIYMLSEFVVASEREGSARAIQEQREATNIKSIVASDSFGNMVDGNLGELMKNLPGITVDYAGEDAAAIRVRGMDPNMASITMDGNSIATNSGSETRSFSLLDFAVGNIETIELDFAPTPERPSNSMGGSINFKTKSAFNQKGRRIRIDGNLSLNTAELEFQKTPGGGRTPDRKLKPGFTFSYTEAFGTVRPVGVAINANYSQKYRFNNSYRLPGGYRYNLSELQNNGGVATASTKGVIPSVEWEEAGAASERRFISVNLDHKLSDSTSIFLYNSFTQDIGLGGYKHRMRVSEGSGGQPAQASFERLVSPSGSPISISAEVNNNNTKSFTINPGVKHRFGDFEVGYDAYLSHSEYSPDPSRQFSINYNLEGLGLTVDDVSGNATGKITQTFGPDRLAISNYNRLSLYNDYTLGDEDQKGAKIDGSLPVVLFGMPIKLQAGGRYNEQNRDTQRFYRKYDLTGNSASSAFGTAAEPKLKQFQDPYFRNQWKFDVAIPNWLSPYSVYDYFTANPNQFYRNELTTFEREASADKQTKEAIYAGYFMATARPLSNFTVLAGARYEYTELKASGHLYDSTASPNPFGAGQKWDIVTPTSPYFGYTVEQQTKLRYSRQTRKKNYDKIFPNLQLKYEPFKDLILRAAGTTNISRPDFGNVLPSDDVRDGLNLIRRSNTRLVPQEGTNFDFNVEYYLPNKGRLTATLFYQKIESYINDVTTIEYIPDSTTGVVEAWTVVTKENAGSGKNEGAEFSYLQGLGLISPKLKGFEFYAAVSLADPTAEYPRNPYIFTPNVAPLDSEIEAFRNTPTVMTTIPLTNIVKKSANARLSYRGRVLSGSIAAFWRDEFARSINTATLEENRQASDIRIDLSLAYQISPRWNAYLDWRNITDEPDERSIFGRTGGFFTSGMVLNVGIRANL